MKLESFSHYLAGLWEGDGHSGYKPRPYIAITFHKKDYPLVRMCQLLLGGSLRRKQEENAWVLIFRKKHELCRFISLVGDKLRTPKSIEIWSIAKWLQKNIGYETFCYDYCLDTSDLDSNAWLAGFLDADGAFKVRFTPKRIHLKTGTIIQKQRVALACVLEQQKLHKKSGGGFYDIMQKIANFLGITLRESLHAKRKYWCVELSSFFRFTILIKYLSNYPLLSSRYLDFVDWLEVYSLIENKKHITDQGRYIILGIKSGMNRKRRLFCWNHLFLFFPFIAIEIETYCPFQMSHAKIAS